MSNKIRKKRKKYKKKKKIPQNLSPSSNSHETSVSGGLQAGSCVKALVGGSPRPFWRVLSKVGWPCESDATSVC